jgi:hypothetical protein
VLNSIIGEDAGGHGVCKDGGRFRADKEFPACRRYGRAKGKSWRTLPHPSSPFRRPATSELPIDNAPTTGAPPSWGEARIVNCVIVSSPPPARRLSARQGRCHKSTWRISDIQHARPVRRGAVARRSAGCVWPAAGKNRAGMLAGMSAVPGWARDLQLATAGRLLLKLRDGGGAAVTERRAWALDARRAVTPRANATMRCAPRAKRSRDTAAGRRGRPAARKSTPDPCRAIRR